MFGVRVAIVAMGDGRAACSYRSHENNPPPTIGIPNAMPAECARVAPIARCQSGDQAVWASDEAAIEARRAAPLKTDLDAISAIASTSDLAAAFAGASRDRVGTPIAMGITIDAKDPDSDVVSVGQGGLRLPDRDYYLVRDNPKFAEARTAYQAHLAKMLALAGVASRAGRPKSATIGLQR